MTTAHRHETSTSRLKARSPLLAAVGAAIALLVSSCAPEPRIVVIGESAPLFENARAATAIIYPFEDDVALTSLGLQQLNYWSANDIDYAWIFELENTSEQVTYVVRVNGVLYDELGDPIRTDLVSSDIALRPGEKITVVEDAYVFTQITPTSVEWTLASVFARGAVDVDSERLTERGLSFRQQSSAISVSGVVENTTSSAVSDYVVAAWCQDSDGGLLAIGQWWSRWEIDGLEAGESAPYEISSLTLSRASVDSCFVSVYQEAS